MNMRTKLLGGFLAALLLVTSVSATSYMPSVENKGAPAAVETEVVLESGETKAAAVIVYDDAEKAVDGIASGNITVTPYVDREETVETTRNELTQAYATVVEAQSLAQIAPSLETVLEQENITADDLVVRDVFHVALDETAKKQAAEGETLGLIFDLGVEENAVVVVMRYVARQDVPEGVEVPPGDGFFVRVWSAVTNEDGDEQGFFDRLWSAITGESEKDEMVWYAVDAENVTVNGDGTVTVRLEPIDGDIGTLALATERVED